jgi:hypothetical protein
VDSEGRTIWIVDAHRDNGKRFIVRSDHMLSALLQLEAAIRRTATLAAPELNNFPFEVSLSFAFRNE